MSRKHKRTKKQKPQTVWLWVLIQDGQVRWYEHEGHKGLLFCESRNAAAMAASLFAGGECPGSSLLGVSPSGSLESVVRDSFGAGANSVFFFDDAGCLQKMASIAAAMGDGDEQESPIEKRVEEVEDSVADNTAGIEKLYEWDDERAGDIDRLKRHDESHIEQIGVLMKNDERLFAQQDKMSDWMSCFKLQINDLRGSVEASNQPVIPQLPAIKSFAFIGKEAFSPMTLGRRDELLTKLLKRSELMWRVAPKRRRQGEPVPFHSLELIWAAERGLIVVRAESMFWPAEENPPCVKAVCEVSGPFLFRRCRESLLRHHSSPAIWQSLGASDWTTPVVLQFSLNRGCPGLQTASLNPDPASGLADLTEWITRFEAKYDYRDRSGVTVHQRATLVDGQLSPMPDRDQGDMFWRREVMQSREDAFRLACGEFGAVKLLRMTRDGVEKWDDKHAEQWSV